DNLSDKESKMGQAFAAGIMKSFSWAGIKSKVAVSFIVTNIGKMLLIMGATSIGVSVVAVAFTSAGKFGYAINETKDVNRYEYAVDLVSPTNEGKMYHAVIQEDPSDPILIKQYNGKPTRTWMGMQIDNTANPQYGDIPTHSFMESNFSSHVKTIFQDWISYTHVPGFWGGIAYENTPLYGWGLKDPSGTASMNYLKGKVQFKALLNVELGGAGQPAKPWDINKQLMPKNQQNLANQDYLKYMKRLAELPKNKSDFGTLLKINNIDKLTPASEQSENWFETLNKLLSAHQQAIDSGKPIYKDLVRKIGHVLTEELTYSPGLSPQVRKSYIQAIVNGFKAGIYPFVLAYDQITMDVQDETYTSIRGEAKFNSSGEEKITSLSIKGINKDSKYIHAGSSNISALENYKGTNTPILINKYMEQFYGLSKGDTFDVDIKNTLDRYTNKTKQTKTMQVVGIVPSYANNEVITLRSIANHALNYDLKEGFNGVFSAEEAPASLTNVNLYSPSGLYPAFNTFNPDADNEYKRVLQAFLTTNAGTEGLPTSVKEFVTRYSNKIYQSTITDVQWARMDDFTFESINHLSSALIILVEVVALIIAIIFIIILGSIMIESNKRNISTLKVVGYRNGEIRNAFLKSLLPSLLFGILIAIPIVFAVLIGMQFAIMGFGAVLIPLSMLGWELLAAAIIVSLIFVWIFSASIHSLKGQSALEAFKE
ncbi:MAG: ABC transporter permease, partial [Mycoplasmataceae bacterium]|nr:ABC transporter permease [Mycoplasmataceae bacterium]